MHELFRTRVKVPMDLGTIAQRVQTGRFYEDDHEKFAEVCLFIFYNLTGFLFHFFNATGCSFGMV